MKKKLVDLEYVIQQVQRNLIPGADESGIASVEEAERWFLKLLGEAPYIEANEITHGYWINTPPYTASNGEYNKAQECSVCNAYFVSSGYTRYSNHPYCCECGAKMDKPVIWREDIK